MHEAWMVMAVLMMPMRKKRCGEMIKMVSMMKNTHGICLTSD